MRLKGQTIISITQEGINSHVGATAGTPAPQTNRLDTKRTQNMGTSSTSTVHAVELRGLVLALQIILDTPPTSVPPNKRAVIFTDNQAASKPSETPSIRPASTSAISMDPGTRRSARNDAVDQTAKDAAKVDLNARANAKLPPEPDSLQTLTATQVYHSPSDEKRVRPGLGEMQT
ncbi:hypothetical protein PDIDSM_5310 [Penicillium digitatum]|nr:hypothetical protein PDIDSM_5310 [Penicillium digitatum]